LVGNKRVEIGIGEHLARALAAVADDDIAQRACGDVAVEGLHGAAESRSGLAGGAQAVGCGLALLTRSPRRLVLGLEVRRVDAAEEGLPRFDA
jgi:hypothetical protein